MPLPTIHFGLSCNDLLAGTTYKGAFAQEDLEAAAPALPPDERQPVQVWADSPYWSASDTLQVVQACVGQERVPDVNRASVALACAAARRALPYIESSEDQEACEAALGCTEAWVADPTPANLASAMDATDHAHQPGEYGPWNADDYARMAAACVVRRPFDALSYATSAHEKTEEARQHADLMRILW